MTKNNNKYHTGLFLIFLSVSSVASAITQKKEAWLGINTQQPLQHNSPWVYSLFSQLRTIDESHPWQSFIVEGGIGYAFQQDAILMAGYRWTGRNLDNGFYQINHLFQQLLWQTRAPAYRVISRSRLEENSRSNQPKVLFRFRERLATELTWQIIPKIHPYFYDEIFFNLNKTGYSSRKSPSENRLFTGCNLYISESTFWEIGYINQFLYQTPTSGENQMNHILSFNYNF